MIFDHIGVVVSDLEAGRGMLEASLGIACWTDEYEDPQQDVRAQFGSCPSGIRYEILVPRSQTSPVARALASKANVINHVGYLVADLKRQAARLADAGFVATGAPKPGTVFGHRDIQFFVSPARFLLELIEAPDHRHRFHSRSAASPA